MKKSKWAQSAMPVSEDRLIELIQSYGADPRRWPEAERAAGLARITESGVGQHELTQAHALDTMLDQLTPPEPSEDFVARTRAMMPAHQPARRPNILHGLLRSITDAVGGSSSWRPAAMLASMVMIFVVGVGVGWMAGNQPAAPGGADESFVFSLVGGSEDQIRVSGPDFPFQLGGPDLIVALH